MDPTQHRSTAASAHALPEPVDVVVVGAGFAGLYSMHRLRGLGMSVRAYEAGDGVGGVWFWNRYPGARCDIESAIYSFSFSEELQQEWHWPERYSAQPDIERYANHVADRFDLRHDIRLGTRVTSAGFDEATNRWRVCTDRGDDVSARFLVLATGALSVPKLPEYPGLDTFGGDTFHTASWPDEEVDFTGRRVGVIGTGSSGIQIIPTLARLAGHLHVFQRTPTYSIPALNATMDAATEREIKENYVERRRTTRSTAAGLLRDVNPVSALAVDAQERENLYEQAWRTAGFGFLLTFNDLLFSVDANRTATDFVASKIRELVDDPATAEQLTPTGYPFGAKRPCVDTGYYPTFNRDDVTLVDVARSPIEGFTSTGLRTADDHYELDAIVFATGFDAITGSLLRIDIRGRDGVTLQEGWAAGPRTLLGVATAGFPNMFVITGPGSPSVLVNMIVAIEQHVEWMTELVEHVRRHGIAAVEATVEAQDAWVDHVNTLAAGTLYPEANSWYLGANVPGKPRVFMPYPGGLRSYRKRCAEVADDGYRGFAFTRADETHRSRAAT